MISQNTSKLILVGALDLLVVGNTMTSNEMSQSVSLDQKIEKLNTASLRSIESTWLKVPAACKARGFNASPQPLENRSIRSQVQQIYSSFEV